MNALSSIACIVGGVGLLALCADWKQTLRAAGADPRFTELNPILGPAPSSRRVNIYFALSALLLTSLFAALLRLDEHAAAIGVAGFVSAVELCCVVNNWALGIPPIVRDPWKQPRR